MRVAILALCLSCAVAAAEERTAAEVELVGTVERQLRKLIRVAELRRDLEFAESEVILALEVASESAYLLGELERLQTTLDRAARHSKLRGRYLGDRSGYLGDKSREVHERISLALAEAARSVEAVAPERYQRYLELLRRSYPSEAANALLGIAFYEPLKRWVSGEDAAVLRAGGDYYGGELLSPERVAELNRQHASWEDPWVLSDEVHELRTTVPLRQANQILGFIGAYRAYVLERFGDRWEFRPPRGKLPVIVTRTRAELHEQMRLAVRDRPGLRGLRPQSVGVAFYLHTGGSLDPCFVTYEGLDATGKTFTIAWDDFEQLLLPLAHEVAHQIAFEYSKFAAQRRSIRHHYWAVEGVANFLAQHAWNGREWILNRKRVIAWGDSNGENPFSYCQRMRGELPPLKTFMKTSVSEFLQPGNYQIATTLVYFLLKGEGGKYRARFLDMLEAVHQVRDERRSFSKAFEGVDLDTLQAEWERFLQELTFAE